MARIRPARGQDRSGDGHAAPGRRPPARIAPSAVQPKQPPSPRPAQPGGNRRKPEKAGTVTKAVAAASAGGSRFIQRGHRRAQEGQLADPHPARSSPPRWCSSSSLSSRSTSPCWTPSSSGSSTRSSSRRGPFVPLVRHQHLLGPREEGEGQPRAPAHLPGPARARAPGGHPHRAGRRDQGRREGPDREAAPAGLRPGQHGHDARRALAGQEHPRRHRLRGRGRA